MTVVVFDAMHKSVNINIISAPTRRVKPSLSPLELQPTVVRDNKMLKQTFYKHMAYLYMLLIYSSS
jgi:hypothetical protein